MSIYTSVEEYSKKLNMTVEQATEMVGSLSVIKEAMRKSQKCPACFARTLEFDSGDMLEGIKGFVHCANDKIRVKDTEGIDFFDSCDFMDSNIDAYIFTVEHDFDIVLALSSELDIRNNTEVVRQLGQPWSDFVDATNIELKQLILNLGVKAELEK